MGQGSHIEPFEAVEGLGYQSNIYVHIYVLYSTINSNIVRKVLSDFSSMPLWKHAMKMVLTLSVRMCHGHDMKAAWCPQAPKNAHFAAILTTLTYGHEKAPSQWKSIAQRNCWNIVLQNFQLGMELRPVIPAMDMNGGRMWVSKANCVH